MKKGIGTIETDDVLFSKEEAIDNAENSIGTIYENNSKKLGRLIEMVIKG